MEEEVKLRECPSGHAEGASAAPPSLGIMWEILCDHPRCYWKVSGLSKAEAIAAWNTRPTDPVKAQLLEALRELTGALLSIAGTHFVDTVAINKARAAIRAAEEEANPC